MTKHIKRCSADDRIFIGGCRPYQASQIARQLIGHQSQTNRGSRFHHNRLIGGQWREQFGSVLQR
jgi:hypothetical protein